MYVLLQRLVLLKSRSIQKAQFIISEKSTFDVVKSVTCNFFIEKFNFLKNLTELTLSKKNRDIWGAIGYLGHFFGSLGTCAEGPVSHHAMQLCLWLFSLLSFGSLWYTVATFLEPFWFNCLDACRLICCLTMVCLPHAPLQILLLSLITIRQWLGATIMSLLAIGNSQSRRVRRAASPLTTGSHQRQWASSLAPCPVDLGDNY
jgi:hypothetical protein